MALEFTLLDSGSATGVTPPAAQNTASVNPSSASEIIVARYVRDSVGAGPYPLPSGLGLTWEQMGFVTDGSNFRVLAAWRGYGAAPEEGVITLPDMGDSGAFRGYKVIQVLGWTGVDVQVQSGEDVTTLTFASAMTEGNGAIAFATDSGGTGGIGTSDIGWTGLHTSFGPNVYARPDVDPEDGITLAAQARYAIMFELETDLGGIETGEVIGTLDGFGVM